jgi:hypothetical protein
MKLRLLSVYHPYIAEPSKLRVELAVAMAKDEPPYDEGLFTVYIEPENIRTITFEQIEKMATDRVLAQIGVSNAS